MTPQEKKEETTPEFDYTTIKTFEHACHHVRITTALPDVSTIPDNFRKAIEAAYKLMVIFQAINNGWTPDWNDTNQRKWWPWFNLSSGFSDSYYICGRTATHVGSHLYTDTSEKAMYIAKQFKQEYSALFLLALYGSRDADWLDGALQVTLFGFTQVGLNSTELSTCTKDY